MVDANNFISLRASFASHLAHLAAALISISIRRGRDAMRCDLKRWDSRPVIVLQNAHERPCTRRRQWRGRRTTILLRTTNYVMGHHIRWISNNSDGTPARIQVNVCAYIRASAAASTGSRCEHAAYGWSGQTERMVRFNQRTTLDRCKLIQFSLDDWVGFSWLNAHSSKPILLLFVSVCVRAGVLRVGVQCAQSLIRRTVHGRRDVHIA